MASREERAGDDAVGSRDAAYFGLSLPVRLAPEWQRRFCSVGKGLVMNIEEALARLNEFSSDHVLVAKPPMTWGAEAAYVRLTEDYRVPDSIRELGFEYLLECEDIERWLMAIKGKKMSSRAVAEFVIHCALYDCAPSWIEDIPRR
jgi:hypothetical protein